MGTKGDRAAKEPLAMQMYTGGSNLTEISKQLDISGTTLRRWKEDSRVFGEDIDGWDKARQQKRSNIIRLKDLFERQLGYVEGLAPCEVSAPMMDTLSKLGALVERWDKVEKALALIGKIKTEYMESETGKHSEEEKEKTRSMLINEVDRILGVR